MLEVLENGLWVMFGMALMLCVQLALILGRFGDDDDDDDPTDDLNKWGGPKT